MNKKDIPVLVKGLRHRLDLTQEQFAREVGITSGTVNQWKNGHRRSQPHLLMKLLEMKEKLDSAHRKRRQ